MRLPHIHMSNGAWIFASAVAMAIIAPAVYAMSNSIVAIGNPSGTTTAYVTQTRQLQTVTTAPTNLVRAFGTVIGNSGCTSVYTPPAGKAIVVTQVTYDLNGGAEGHEVYAVLADSSCSTPFDYADTIHAYEAQSHTFPTGLPLASVALTVGGSGYSELTITGYLIPVSQLPPEPPASHGHIKGMAGR